MLKFLVLFLVVFLVKADDFEIIDDIPEPTPDDDNDNDLKEQPKKVVIRDSSFKWDDTILQYEY